jgi:hypothetical protein
VSVSGWEITYVIFTGLLVAVGAVGVGYAVQTLRSIQEQARIAKDALIASQRPRLSIKHVFVTPPADITRIGDSQEWKVNCILANVGASQAEVIESNVTIRRLGIGSLEGLLPAIPFYDTKYSFGTFVVQPGERKSAEVPLDTNSDGMKLRLSHSMAEKIDGYGQPHSDTNPLVCYGFFKYRDESGVVRISGFGCRWNRSDMSFNRLDDPDYDYED